MKYITIFLQPAHNKEWGFHNARVNKVAWSPNSTLIASGSLDTTIIIWSVATPAKHTIIKSKSHVKNIF
jgi:WD40 repeat protein